MIGLTRIPIPHNGAELASGTMSVTVQAIQYPSIVETDRLICSLSLSFSRMVVNKNRSEISNENFYDFRIGKIPMFLLLNEAKLVER